MFKNDDVCDLVQIDLNRVRKIRAALVQPDAVQGLADTFSALGDPTRVRILDALSHGELCVCDLAAVLKLSQSAVSHQLRLLRGLRLVRPRRDGRVVFYSLDDQHIISLFKQTLQHVEESATAGRWRHGATGCDRAAKGRAWLKPTRSAARTAKTNRRRPARGFAAGSRPPPPRSSSRHAQSAGLRRSRIGARRSSSAPPSLDRSFPPSAPGSRSRAARSTSMC